MLTAIEINDLWNQSKNPDDFARAIERAVLAKAGEQESVWFAEGDLYKTERYARDAIEAAGSNYEPRKLYELSVSYSPYGFISKDTAYHFDHFGYARIEKLPSDFASVPLYAHPLPAQSIPEGWKPIETMPFNTPVLVSDEKIIASMFFYKRKDRGYENSIYPQFIGAGDADVMVSLYENGCYSKLRWWRPMLNIPLSASPKP